MTRGGGRARPGALGSTCWVPPRPGFPRAPAPGTGSAGSFGAGMTAAPPARAAAGARRRGAGGGGAGAGGGAAIAETPAPRALGGHRAPPGTLGGAYHSARAREGAWAGGPGSPSASRGPHFGDTPPGGARGDERRLRVGQRAAPVERWGGACSKTGPRSPPCGAVGRPPPWRTSAPRRAGAGQEVGAWTEGCLVKGPRGDRGWRSGGGASGASSGVEFLPCGFLEMRGGSCSGELGWWPACLSPSSRPPPHTHTPSPPGFALRSSSSEERSVPPQGGPLALWPPLRPETGVCARGGREALAGSQVSSLGWGARGMRPGREAGRRPRGFSLSPPTGSAEASCPSLPTLFTGKHEGT